MCASRADFGQSLTARLTLQTKARIAFVLSLVGFVLFWEYVLIDEFTAAQGGSIHAIGDRMAYIFGNGVWIPHLKATMWRVVWGFLLAITVGTILAVIMGFSRFWDEAFREWVVVGLLFPNLFIIIIAAMWWGFSDLVPIVAAGLSAVAFQTLQVYEGIQDIDDRLIDMSRSFNVSRGRIIKRVILRSILPEWFSGARQCFSISWKIVTLSEFFVSSTGLGAMIAEAMRTVSLDAVLAWTLLFTVTMLVLEFGILRNIEKWLFSWREETSLR